MMIPQQRVMIFSREWGCRWGGSWWIESWMMQNHELLPACSCLGQLGLILFPFLRIVLGSLVLFSMLEIISHIFSASLWFCGLAAEPFYSTRVSLRFGIRSACLAASTHSSRCHALREAIGWHLSDDTSSSQA